MNEPADRVVTPLDTVEDGAVDVSLRPKTLNEYIGQPAMREKLEIFLEAARRLNVAPELCHVFEDGDLGLEAARLAGMTATDVRGYL